jgi:hypothetical protein
MEPGREQGMDRISATDHEQWYLPSAPHHRILFHYSIVVKAHCRMGSLEATLVDRAVYCVELRRDTEHYSVQ